MPPINICTQPSSRCVTIDSTQTDVALSNARFAFYGPSLNGPVHGTTARAVTNLLSCLDGNPRERRVMIVGHGVPGVIITGSGAAATGLGQRIGLSNFPRWRRPVGRLKSRITELTFCSCDTGAELDGANLLMRVANHIEATVSGFTGLIFIGANGNITCETGGIWQHAQPKTDLPPVPAPVHRFGEVVSLRLKYGEEYRTVKIDRVSAVSFFDSEEKGKPAFSLEGEAAQKLVGTINFTEPAEIDGAPLAMTTGMLEIEYIIDEQPDERTFVIFNDRLLYDQATPNTFYFASPEFAKAISKNRPEAR